MRKLTFSEQKQIESREAAFDGFMEEMMPVLTEFIGMLGLPEPSRVLVEAELYLPPLDEWLKVQVINPDDKVLLLTRLGYFIGEYLIQQFDGQWFVNDIPDSLYFARFVVGRFQRISNPNAMVDPFEVAAAFIAEPPGRSLVELMEQARFEIIQA